MDEFEKVALLLDKRLELEKTRLKDASGKTCLFSETGPVSLGLVEALIALVKEQGKEIARLKGK